MNWNANPPRPSGADDVKLGVDDAQVIAKTLPSTPMRSKAARLQRQANHAVACTRDYVLERPVLSVLIAAAGAAALTAALIAFMRSERP